MEENRLLKYPRTPHLEGSRLQPGDEDLSQIRFSEIAGRHLVVEEKCDGANSAISFSPSGKLLLQSRGHYLTGGARERHYNLMKQWAAVQQDRLYPVLGSRYIMYGEWMYAKHSIFYDRLPHYFLEFDVFDRERGVFLDTPGRRHLLEGLPLVPMPVLAEGSFTRQEDLLQLLGPSRYISANHREALRAAAREQGLDEEQQCRETDSSDLMEGLYIKIEEDGIVRQRLKFVRPTFLQTVETAQTHWLNRPIVPNRLAVPIEKLFEG